MGELEDMLIRFLVRFLKILKYGGGALLYTSLFQRFQPFQSDKISMKKVWRDVNVSIY